MTQSLTIGETISQLHQSLSEYIEATYHISNPQLIEQRKRLLKKVGVIHQKPFLESTPRYQAGSNFADIDGLPDAALEIFNILSSKSGDIPQIIYDPPYQHQEASIKGTLVDGKSLIVMTGTGSGKTECFLLPILGKLAREAKLKPHVFKTQSAVRAMVLYPMNALVNDQLGRLRLMLGNSRVVNKFDEWSGRPARFARYTSRTLYPGVRDAKKDQIKLKPIGNYYVKHLLAAQDENSAENENSLKLVSELKKRGKFPAKPDLKEWYGEKGKRWTDEFGNFKRCVTLPNDPELFTRHEVLEAASDILVTNYSMLEYMLMRPLERPIFNQTRDWLEKNPEEKFLLIVDEAHLYRGAAGAEVALLIRRLRSRLGITADRLQVVCTSASFKDKEQARKFSSQLTGKKMEDFRVVQGDLALRTSAAKGTKSDAEILAEIDLNTFYDSADSKKRLETVASFLKYRNIPTHTDINLALYQALEQFPPMSLLINSTMKEAQAIESLGEQIFENTDKQTADQAVTALIALGSMARRNEREPGLLPCRIHAFFRGFSGLWACLDKECSGLEEIERGGPTGKLYSQPRENCDHCNSRVFEFYTCRNCGSAYVRAYTNNIENPEFLWSEHGERFSTTGGTIDELEPLDILLENPIGQVEPIEIDLDTGRLNPDHDEEKRLRTVFIKKNRFQEVGEDEEEDSNEVKLGEFKPCGVCGEMSGYGRSSVQDHQTKGDQPFQSLITKQLQVQPPSPNQLSTPFAPLRGRKVLIFSDSRQTAARLAPNIQNYSSRDALRPLIIKGFKYLQSIPELKNKLSLSHSFLAVLIAANKFGLRLRPEIKSHESFDFENEVNRALNDKIFEMVGNELVDSEETEEFVQSATDKKPPSSLMEGIYDTIVDKYYGLESLALASIIEKTRLTRKIKQLPDIPGIAETDEEKIALARVWLYQYRTKGFWLNQMPGDWASTKVKPFKVTNPKPLNYFLISKSSQILFQEKWKPELINWFLEAMGSNTYRVKGDQLTLSLDGEWLYCKKCRTNQLPFPGKAVCIKCGDANIISVDPLTDSVFRARKAYYRSPTEEALKPNGTPPVNVIAAEHTAQLNTAQAGEVFSKAEENELLFQDVDLGTNEQNLQRTAIDVLSCTTTMEVGIDIGSLSGVALRNLPPARANYQQRAGRAGRRGNAVATVIAFGSADSHDEHYFSYPDEMIRGDVIDPFLTLNNYDIARRHVTAYLMQRYHQARLPNIEPTEQPHLFAVLGKVSEFKQTNSVLNFTDFGNWLRSEENKLKQSIEDWIPDELQGDDRKLLFDNLIEETLSEIGKAIKSESEDPTD
ncbi:MAG: DEAD/DEAH box helicase, partial [Aridibacter sp.]